MIQVVNLAFFTYAAAYAPQPSGVELWYYTPTVVYGLAMFTGLLGGAVYVHGYQRISDDISPRDHCEFALSAVSVAEGLGIAVADVLSLWWQACLYKANDIPDDVVACPF